MRPTKQSENLKNVRPRCLKENRYLRTESRNVEHRRRKDL